MLIDIQGKVKEKRLAYNNTLLPLFEAIVNSIHAIEEDSATKPGIIEIDIIRTNEQELSLSNNKKPQITEFHVTDNGVGFDDKNFNSFNRAHSTYKMLKGGKGLGRFIWLRAFQFVEIESIFKENGIYKLRKFNFEPTQDGIEKHSIEDLPIVPKRHTSVRLRRMKKDYWQWCNNILEDIAFKIIEHCFIYFLRVDCPIIMLKDGEEKLIINDLFRLYTDEVVKKEIKIEDENFTINIVRLYHARRIDNKIHFVAHTREVENKDISKLIPELDNYLVDKEGNQFSIGVYVTSRYFDDRVNDDRTKIQFVDANRTPPELFEEIDENYLIENIIEVIKAEFKDDILLLGNEREERISNFIEHNPQYRKLFKYKRERLKRISSRLSDKDLEIELFKVKQEIDLEIRVEAESVMNQIEKLDNQEAIDDFKQQHKELYEKIIDIGNSKLAEYVLYRKFILNFLEKQLQQTQNGKYAKEEVVHKLIFPLKTESDTIGHEDHNLWMIDERLAFHNYLASDKSLKQNKRTGSNSDKRPDIVIFNKPFAFSNSEKPYSSIVLIEFKRPMRDDYNEDENPIKQVTKYTRELLENKTTDKQGRPIDLKPTTPIYAYIVCDMTHNLRIFAEDDGFTPSPDNDGYFRFINKHNLYIELISFDKILRDAKQRNKIFFEKLNLQTI